ncbi:NADH-quinone oxidoreductase subunit NuoH [Planctopirus hydrillae]|uniref:NADH-quinone oxidoreductase subunit H n=1 Tax=Planctopirus hydrillae TaxID=1841610 RepID=A0A1C3EMZ1_9PLAN|nr:NADH-quinone oxidoreductase subunit NuoH [Planctopirus hydrillae]ODA34592.1 hydroxyacid dehydrogenase [Planctopirus hydrillae]
MSWEFFLVTLITIGVAFGGLMGTIAYLILVERRLAAFIQDRYGPNRVGWAGLLQPIADGAKFLLKEDVIPGYVNKTLYILGPSIAVFTAMAGFAIVPFGPVDQAPSWMRFVIAPDVNIGMIYIFCVGSLGVYGVILGGWASNNKYSSLGSMRASAQVVSYEIPLGMSIIGVVLMTSSLSLNDILMHQAKFGILGWNVWTQPLALLIFFVSALAETNRLPFDLSECEQELVGGFHTEYSSMKFALYFLGEYAHIITVCFLTAILFFGGWQFPLIAEADSAYLGATLVKVVVLLTKVLLIILLIMFIRWTIPRFRFDQLMNLAWLGLIPMAALNILVVMTAKQFDWPIWTLPLGSLAIFVAAGLIGTSGKFIVSDQTVDFGESPEGYAHVHS